MTLESNPQKPFLGLVISAVTRYVKLGRGRRRVFFFTPAPDFANKLCVVQRKYLRSPLTKV